MQVSTDQAAELLELRKENSALREETYILTERIGALRHKISDFRNLNLESIRKIVKLEGIIHHLEIVIDEIHGEAV
jgi:transposase-like protein